MLRELLEFSCFNELLDSMKKLMGGTFGIADREGAILASSGWTDVCTHFHHAIPLSDAICSTSDLCFARNVIIAPGTGKTELLSGCCPLGLTNHLSPLFLQGDHVGFVFIGQVFLEKPDLDHFKENAK
jgi:ligand-binding sensor protein